eukprot:1727495-Amphidinium_carterae.1
MEDIASCMIAMAQACQDLRNPLNLTVQSAWDACMLDASYCAIPIRARGKIVLSLSVLLCCHFPPYNCAQVVSVPLALDKKATTKSYCNCSKPQGNLRAGLHRNNDPKKHIKKNPT